MTDPQRTPRTTESIDSESHAASAGAVRFTLPQIAHDLNSLLDGSRRLLGLVQDRIGIEGVTRAETGDVQSRLSTVRQGLDEMAALLERVMSDGQASITTGSGDLSIADAIRQIRGVLSGLVEEGRIELEVDVEEGLESLPVGDLYPVILNGLKNAIEAASSTSRSDRWVGLTMQAEGDVLALHIADNGTGLTLDNSPVGSSRPGGHGLGLGICRSAVAQLGGRMRLMNIPFDGGAVFEVEIPLPRESAA